MFFHLQQKFDHLQLRLKHIQTATNNFADENLITQGETGRIYKGQLSRSGELIDIVARRYNRAHIKVFAMEIMMLSRLNHPNLVSIVGFCNENGETIIVNKFEPNGSLDQYISDPVTLTWTRRIKICLAIASVLSYIHYEEGRDFSVIHRDIKSSKILLGDKWEPKLSEFRFSMMQPAARRHGLVLDDVYGTPGYMDPAYARTGGVSHKSDVYSLGVVLFEVLSGRKAFIKEDNEVLLANLAKFHYENRTLDDFILPGLRNQMDLLALKIFSEVAYCCLNEQGAQRPSVDRVIIALKQALELQLERERSALSREGTSINYGKVKDLEHLKIGLDAIKIATENFNEKYYIGSGGYGMVYKAELEHFDSSVTKVNEEYDIPKRRSTVAIKYITDRKDTQGEQGFIAEIETLSSCKHPNIVSLLGFCYEHPHMILIYEHVSKGSLDDYLGTEGKMTNLTWVQRIKICIDIARGLDYIHTTMDYKKKIIHRDVKSANILLGENWEAKIADFGLSKLQPLNHTKSTINTNKVAGTQVYLDPEYESTGKLKKESDVYSFGVVLFEMLTGRLAFDSIYTNENDKGLAPIVRQKFENGTLINEMVDPKLKEESTFTLIKGPNQDSLHTFSKIGYQCLAEWQDERPTMKVVIKELEKALNFQEAHKDNLRISFDHIRLATNNFNSDNIIGKGRSWRAYKGEILRANGPTTVAVKQWYNKQKDAHEREKEFLTELEILFEYKHENIIGLVGYCNDYDEKIIVYEYASNGSLDSHLKDASLRWTDRLKIGIDVAVGLDFLHGGGTTQAPVLHGNIDCENILLNGDWKVKLSNFEVSLIASVNNEFDFVVNNPWGKFRYMDPKYNERALIRKQTDIHFLGLVLLDMMCGRMSPLDKSRFRLILGNMGTTDELVFKGIKDKIVPKSLTAFVKIVYECIHRETEKRPTASEVVLKLKEALEFQEDVEIWEAKLPRDYKEIMHMSKTHEMYSDISNKKLYDMFFSKGILLQDGKVWLSISNNGEKNEMVSVTTFSYENHKLHKWRCIKKSRFQRVVKMMHISNLKIQIKIKTQFLSPNVIYGAYLVFKFCDPRKFSSNLMYVNLKYQMGSEILHAYFATIGVDEWMMIELCRLMPYKKDVDFEVLIESLSRYYCGSGAIYVEGIHFRAINDATLKVSHEVNEKPTGVETVLKSNSDFVQRVPLDYLEITQLEDGQKYFSSLSKVTEKNGHMLPAKMVLCESSNVTCCKWKSLAESQSRFLEVAELLSQQVFRIKCEIETQKLSSDTDYACYLIFELSQKCHGLQCPVKVRDVLLRKNKEFKFLYFRFPRLVNLHSIERVPKKREDGLLEVIVWEFSSGSKLSDGNIPMSLKLRCYEGTMSGLLVYGIEFRPI